MKKLFFTLKMFLAYFFYSGSNIEVNMLPKLIFLVMVCKPQNRCAQTLTNETKIWMTRHFKNISPDNTKIISFFVVNSIIFNYGAFLKGGQIPLYGFNRVLLISYVARIRYLLLQSCMVINFFLLPPFQNTIPFLNMDMDTMFLCRCILKVLFV